MFSLSQLCWRTLARGVLASAIWSGFWVFHNGCETLAQVTSAYDFREVKDLKSVAIRVNALGGAFASYHYSLSVHGDGMVEYYGHFATSIPGLHRSHLSEAEVLLLLAAFRDADCYSLHDESDLFVFDAPTMSIELSVDGHTKTVTDRLGESKAFRVFMDRILEISDAQRWLQNTAEGETALHFAAGLASSAWSILGPVADYTERPTASFWPYVILETPNPEVVAHLLAAGAEPNAVDFEGATPLIYTAEMGSQEVLRALLAAGADPDAQDAEGRTALMYAADHLETESVRLLVQAGADVTLRDSNGLTALKRVRHKPSKFIRKMFSSSREQIIHILQVAQTSR